MFSLTLLDHLRLTFAQIINRYKIHTGTAQSHFRWNRRLRSGEALLMAAVSLAACAAAFTEGRVLAIAAAALAAAALIVLLVHLTFDFETSAHAHAQSSSRLWTMRERYRALLSDLRDGVLDLSEARLRRDSLMVELAAIYEQAPAALWGDSAAQGTPVIDDSENQDEEVDLFLPPTARSA